MAQQPPHAHYESATAHTRSSSCSSHAVPPPSPSLTPSLAFSSRFGAAAAPSPSPSLTPALTTPALQSRTTSVADTLPRSEYNAPRCDQAMPSAIKVSELDQSTLSVLDSARHQRRKAPRKSFSRAVSHPVSACERAARAGMAINSKQAISGLQAAGSSSVDRVRFRVIDEEGRLRSTLTQDGTVLGPHGQVLSYIEADGTVGDANLQYLGEVAAARGSSAGFVTGADDKLVAEVDYGRAVLRDLHGSTLVELRRGGELLGHWGASCGRLDGFDFTMLQAAAAYLTLVDPDFVKGK